MSGGDFIGNKEDGSPAGRPIESMYANPAVFSYGNAETTKEGRRQVVAVPLERKGELEDALRRDSKTA